ncbi:MAG: SMC-Scp complex subunit ScpB, partial [Clostridia bacterium]|nr:SMC-Scp complex subunit ScpB [Clostridia bacterium]
MDKLIQTVEAIVFLSGRPIAISDIADKLSVSLQEVEEAGKALAERYSGESGVHFLCFNKKFQMSTNPDYADSIEQVLNPIREKELTRALLEVCAIIAYRQPVTRLEVEDLRGVNSDYSIALLAKNNLIEVVGRKDAIGK